MAPEEGWFGQPKYSTPLKSNLRCIGSCLKYLVSKLEPVIWLRVLVTLAYMKGRTYVRTDVHDVMAIKPNFLTSIGYHVFLTMVLRAREPSACAELRYKRGSAVDEGNTCPP